MIVASSSRGLGGFWAWWSDLVVPDGAADVSYSSVEELTVKDPDTLTPEERERLEATVLAGEIRRQQRARHRSALVGLAFIAGGALAVGYLVRSFKRSA